MSTPIRIALVGIGKIARDQHLPAIAASESFELVAAVDRCGELLGELPFFSSIEALAASGIAVDAVALCTPPQVRTSLAQFAIGRGWHLLLEKPPAATLAEASVMRDRAAARGVSLFASWHSRYAACVEPARRWLAERTVRDATVLWAEDVRRWHPGQDWIFEHGGFGVFDPAINALSILTHILPDRLFVDTADIEIPANRAAAIAASATFRDRRGASVAARFDFLQQGRQSWNIAVRTDRGSMTLGDGGAVMTIDGAPLTPSQPTLTGEYSALYRHFAELVHRGASDADLAPLQLVADIHLKARTRIVDPFDW